MNKSFFEDIFHELIVIIILINTTLHGFMDVELEMHSRTTLTYIVARILMRVITGL